MVSVVMTGKKTITDFASALAGVLLASCFLYQAEALADDAGRMSKESIDGVPIWKLEVGNTRAQVALGQGANVFSIQQNGVEFMHQPKSAGAIGGVSCGVPILYPTPNRVADAQFTFDGKTVSFPANAGKNFIHGLVNRTEWKLVRTEVANDHVTLKCVADFQQGTQLHSQFPFPHRLFLTIELRDSVIRWTYEVDNEAGATAVPFGFALHPYFAYQGERANTHLTIPATHLMEASPQRLPSGKLVDAATVAGLKLNQSASSIVLGEPVALGSVDLDDVFFGVTSSRTTLIDFRDTQTQIEIAASDEFTHLVVWTPRHPFFGVESQTCSTDAHNLHAAGHREAAHLQICPPGESMTGWVEYRFHVPSK